ncbi:glycosyltransferase family 39 protein [Alicyclobacillus dauci]|uniref:Glycosyltransferase family 39 protein n=1 Tax=Alicyclobacillus dauci TaxID=1475485 RepID=A0ABY6Z7W9_9BACL|nr:glycosyltransferase family 39 protein [Alicyclobacillus dauci]WAH38830.1 glycosyltransferase family 39 protein [Alicyclobacillus dauci]
MTRYRDRRDFVASITLVIIATLYHLYFARDFWRYPIHLGGDAVHYDHSAVVLLLKHVYTYWSWGPAAQVTPGYPLFLEFAYWITLITSHNHQVQMHVATTIQHLLAAATVFGLYRIMRYFLPIWASFVGAVLWLIYPPATWAADQLLTETLYVFFLVWFTWSFLFALQNRSFWRFVLAGVMLALTTLVRPSIMPLVVAPLVLLLERQDWPNREALRTKLTNWLGYLAAFIVCMLPWWVRNVRVMHHFTLTDDDMGNPLLFGSDPNFQHDTNLASGLTPGQQEQLAIHRIIEGFTQHPLVYLKWYTIDKLGLLFGTPWYMSTPGYDPTILTRITFGYAQIHLVWVILGAVGLILGFWRPRMRWVSAMAVFLVVVQLPFIPINRYVFPNMPFMFIGVMILVDLAVKLIRNRRATVPNG